MASPSSDVEFVRRKGFSGFVQISWPQIEGTPLIWSEHLDLVCKHLEAVADGEIRDLCINVPPGSSKSTLGSVLFPVFCWIKHPWKKFINTTYDQSLSYRFAERSLDLMTSPWFKERWGKAFECGFGIVKDESAAVAFYENDKGGARYSTMMGGAAIGRHAHILMVDDPIKPDDLRAGGDSAKAALDLAWDRFVNTFSTRRADPVSFARVVIMQRLHVEDVAGKFMRAPGCVKLILPMEFEPENAYVSKWGSDWRTEKGELLCPARFPDEVIETFKRDMTPRNYAAQHQQRPTPESGALFQRDWFAQRWTQVPNGLRYLISVDATMKEGNDADYVVLQVWAWQGANYYLLDQVRQQMSFSDTIKSIKALKAKWPHVGQILIETKANGMAIVDTLRRAGVPGILECDPQGGKFARASAVEPFLRAGNCYFPEHAHWMEGLIEEAITFPVGSHDDQVDCMSQALLYLTGQNKRTKFKQAMANIRSGKQRVLGVRTVF